MQTQMYTNIDSSSTRYNKKKRYDAQHYNSQRGVLTRHVTAVV